jgi:hypothetical protein
VAAVPKAQIKKKLLVFFTSSFIGNMNVILLAMLGE